MKKIVYTLIQISLFLALVIPVQSSSPTIQWQKGAGMQPKTTTDFDSDSFRQSLRDLKNIGANYVSLVIPYHVTDITSSDIVAEENTPTDASLISAINYAHSLGMGVMIAPHIDTHDGNWRAYINPQGKDRIVWFNKYQSILEHYATLAQENNVEEFCIGTELVSMSTSTSDPANTDIWLNMIKNVRTFYNGKLTYSANWGGYEFGHETVHIEFWGALDAIGISAYYSLPSPTNNPAADEDADLLNAWKKWDTEDIKPLYEKYHKPITFTETGYKSIENSHSDPWNSHREGIFDENEQARNFDVLFLYWHNKGYITGAFVWDWDTDPNAGGYNSQWYTPQGKKAEEVIAKWFSFI
jgi:hypothetical protein